MTKKGRGKVLLLVRDTVFKLKRSFRRVSKQAKALLAIIFSRRYGESYLKYRVHLAGEKKRLADSINKIRRSKKQIERKELEEAKRVEREKRREEQRVRAKYNPVINKLDREISHAEHVSKTTFKRFYNLHNYLRYHSKFYDSWHQNKWSDVLNSAGLVVILLSAFIAVRTMYNPMLQKALADAATCTWNGSVDGSWDTADNWSCGHGPTSEDNIVFAATTGNKNSLTMTSNKTVASVSSTSGFDKTFDTNYYNLTVNGDFTWQKSTLNFTGTSEVTVTGNFEISGTPTFGYSSSTLILSGATNTTLNTNKELYNLTINKSNSSNTVTLSPATTSVRSTFALAKGTLNSNTLQLTQTNATYSIGKDSGGGTATVELNTSTGAQAISASGGTATTNTTINKTAGTVTWDGSANIKNLNVPTSGSTLTIRSGRIVVPNDNAQGKISCGAGATLNIDGNSQGTTMIQLRSDVAGQAWDLENNASCTMTNVDWVDVKDSNATTAIAAVTNGIDSGNNTNWDTSFTALANTTTWNSSGSTDCNLAGNWSAGLPDATHYGLFTEASSVDCTLSANLSTLGIISNDGYTGTFSTNATNKTLTTTGTNSTFTWGGGTFNGNGSAINHTGMTLISGSYVASSGTTSISGYIIVGGAVFNNGNGTFITIGIGVALIPDESQPFNNFTIELEGLLRDLNVATGKKAVVNGTLLLSVGRLFTGVIDANGTISVASGFNGGSGTVIVDTNNNQSFTIPTGTSFPGLTLDSASTTVSFAAGATAGIGGTLCIKNGIFTASSGTTNLRGDFLHTGITGAFNHNSGTVSFMDYNTGVNVNSSENFYNLTLNKESYMRYFTIASDDTVVVLNTLNLARGRVSTGTIVAKGEVIIGADSNSGGNGNLTLSGTGTQTLTFSGGTPPSGTFTIDKPSGKAIITGTGTLSGNINISDNATNPNDTLEFAPGYTYTMTTGKTLTVSSGTTLRYPGTSGSPIVVTSSGNWTLTKSGNVYANYLTVDHSQASATVYAMNSTDGLNNTNWDFTTSTCNWINGQTGTWQDTTKWDCAKVPDANDIVVINSTSGAGTVTTAGDISFGTLTIGTSLAYDNTLTIGGSAHHDKIASGGDVTITYRGKITQSTAWGDDPLAINGNLYIASMNSASYGTLNHSDNSTAEDYRLNLTVAGNLTVDPYGQINVDSLGYDPNYGSGKGTASNGAGGYGGNGGGRSAGGVTYGSVSNPEDLGSGSYPDYRKSSGGGAIKLAITGALVNNGRISAVGQDGGSSGNGGPAGSGGSINITAASASGSGAVNADGGGNGYAYNSGGGGRIALNLISSDTFGSLNIHAYSGVRYNKYYQYGGAGTIYKKTYTQSLGSVEIKNNNYSGSHYSSSDTGSAGTSIPSGQSWQFDTITVDARGDLQIPTGTTLNIQSNSVLSNSSGTTSGFISWRGGTLVLPSDGNFTISKATINADSQTPFNAITSTNWTNLNNLTVASDGKLSHSDNENTEKYKLNLSVPGNLTVAGSINVDSRGYNPSYGPGVGAASGAAGGYGGRGGGSGGITYGDATNPISLGSGSYADFVRGSGGGSIILSVGGTTNVTGSISAVGQDGGWSGNAGPGGSGGSVNITTAVISGSGTISADGGGTTYVTNSGGGGRVAVKLTSSSSFDQLNMHAYAGNRYGSSYQYGAAGTVYKKTSSQTYGTITIDTSTKNSSYGATLCGEGSNYDSTCATSDTTNNLDGLTLSNYGKLALAETQTFNYIHDLTIPTNTSLMFISDHDGDPAGGAWPTFNMTGNLTVEGSISASGMGFVHDAGPGAGSGTTNGGGGGFGGVGGNGASESSGGGSTYGSSSDIAYVGSGGGKSTGGSGGGHVEINVTGNFLVNKSGGSASISSDGSAGTTTGGGGSGGAIKVYTSGSLTIGSNGAITANGGNSVEGGSGGGGRIFLTSRGGITNSGTVTASHGTVSGGGSAGADGTVNLQNYPVTPSLLTPSNAATDQSQNLSMTFFATDADANWLRYKVQLADDQEFTTNVKTFTQGDTTPGGQTVSDGGLTATFSGQGSAGSPTGTGYTSGATATLTIDSSTPLIYGHTYYWHAAAIDPSGTNDWTLYQSTPRSFTVAAINNATFTTGLNQTIMATDSCSSVLTFETRNTIGQAVKLLSDTVFTLSAGQTGGGFYSDSSCTHSISQVTVATGSSAASFYYKNTHSYVDPFNLTAAENPSQGWSDAQTTFRVNPGVLDHFTLSQYNSSYTADDTFDVKVTAKDSLENDKFDYYGSSAKIWFTASCAANLPYTSSSTDYYTFQQADYGSKTILNDTKDPANFRLQKVGSQKITLHNANFDQKTDLATQTSSITITPGATDEFYLEDYPRALPPNYSEFAVSGKQWTASDYANQDYDMKVTVRDQFDNVKTDYNGEIWFSLYNNLGVEGVYDFNWDSNNHLPFDASSDHGVKNANGICGDSSDDYSCFVSTTAGKNLSLRITDGSVTSSYTIYIKPLGLASFTLTTSSTLHRSGGNDYDQGSDEQWNADGTPTSVTVTAYDSIGNVKVDYDYDEDTKAGMVYFWSPERTSYSAGGSSLSNQEFPYTKSSATDTTRCFQFGSHTGDLPGTTTFTPDDDVFTFFKGGRRTVYVSECIDPSSSYATDNGLYDPNFESSSSSRSNEVSTGVFPASGNVAVATHVPGSTHENDQHSNDANDNITVGPGDQKLTLSWKNPFDTPAASTSPKIYIYQSSNGTDYSLLSTKPSVTGASQWQSVDVTGLTNDQLYYFKLKLAYKRADETIILSDFSSVVTGTPKAIAPVDVTASQLSVSDADNPGKVAINYKLRFPSAVSFEYFDSTSNPPAWHSISDSAVSGEKNDLKDLTDYNFDSPVSHTTYLDMSTDFSEQYLVSSFKVRVNVDVEGQGTSNSECKDPFTLDSKDPAGTSLKVNATGDTAADLTIAATDDSEPITMMISNKADFSGASWESYSSSKLSYNIEGASTVYIKFRDNYNNITNLINDIRTAPASFAIKDASNIATDKYRLVLTWDDAQDVDHYNVWKSTDGHDYAKVDEEIVKNGFIDISLDSTKTYAYKVTSEDPLGNVSQPAGPVSSMPGSAPDVTAQPRVELFGWKQDQGVRAKITWDTDQLANSNVDYSVGGLKVGADRTSEGGQIIKTAGNPEMTYNHEIWLYNLEPQTKYYFKAISANEIQISGYSDVLEFTTPAKVALLVSNLTISDVNMDSALIDWDTSKQSTTLLEYGTSESYGESVEDSNFNTDHTFKLTDLTSGTKYYLRVKATDSDGNVTYSDQYYFQTPEMPVVSSVSIKEVSYSTATIEWSTNVNTDSNVEFGQGSLSGMQGKADSTTLHSVTIIGLDSKTSYSFKVRSKDQFGNVAQGDMMSFTTSVDTQAPKITDVKSEVTASGSGDAIKYQAVVSWSTDEPSTSKIEYSAGISGDYTESTTEDESLNSTHFMILQDLSPNSSYHFRVVSSDKAGNRASSEDSSLITPPKEKSLVKVILDSLQDTFSWVSKLREKFGN